MNNELKQTHIAQLKEEFGNDFFNMSAFAISLTAKSQLAHLARLAKYKKPKDGYFGLGGSYFEHLKKIAN